LGRRPSSLSGQRLRAVSEWFNLADDHVRLEVFLPWFLAKLVGTIQPLIRKEGTLLLEKKK
jgi:hypothetical protein